MKTNYIVYHDNCLDGFLSALLMRVHLYNNNITDFLMVPANYGDMKDENEAKIVPAVAGDTVWLVDFSYPAAHVNALLDKGVNVGIYDHHKTTNVELISNVHQRENVEELTKKYRHQNYNCTDCNGSGLFGRLMNNEELENSFKMSGAGIVLDLLNHTGVNTTMFVLNNICGKDIIKTVAIAEIHDLWLHDGKLDHAASHLAFWFKGWYRSQKDIREKITSDPENSLYHFDQLRIDFISTSLEQKLEIGKKLVEESIGSIREECKKAVEVQFNSRLLDGLRVGFIPGDGPKKLGISTTGSILVKEFGFDVAIMVAVENEGSTIYSVRSNQHGKDVDVAFICKMFHDSGLALTGGGHRNAAGATFVKQEDFFTIIAGN